MCHVDSEPGFPGIGWSHETPHATPFGWVGFMRQPPIADIPVLPVAPPTIEIPFVPASPWRPTWTPPPIETGSQVTPPIETHGIPEPCAATLLLTALFVGWAVYGVWRLRWELRAVMTEGQADGR